jgi:hypothetical protein
MMPFGVEPLLAAAGNLVEAQSGEGGKQRKAPDQRIEHRPGVEAVHPHGQHDADNGIDQRHDDVVARLRPEIGGPLPQGGKDVANGNPADDGAVEPVAGAGDHMETGHGRSPLPLLQLCFAVRPRKREAVDDRSRLRP